MHDFKAVTIIKPACKIQVYNDKSESDWLNFICETTPDMPDLESFRQRKVQKIETELPWVAFKEQINDPGKYPFPTPSGKIEIFSRMFETMKNENIPPIPKYIPSWEGPEDGLVSRYPIQLVSPHSRARVNSQFYTIPRLKKLQDDRIWINPKDAQCRRIENGDDVIVTNDRGRLYIKARVTDHIMPGVASLDAGAWYTPDEGGVDHAGCVNVLTRDDMSPSGAFPCNTCLVEIRSTKNHCIKG